MASVYDELNVVETAISNDEADTTEAKKVSTAMETIYAIDDDIVEVEEELRNFVRDHKGEELRFSEVEYLLENNLPDIIKRLEKIRERLY